jgi:hypothetical protein
VSAVRAKEHVVTTPSDRIKAVLLRVRELTANATPGPWVTLPNAPHIVAAKSLPDGGSIYLADLFGDDDTEGETEATGEFITASRTLLPRLAEALDVAVAELESVGSGCGECGGARRDVFAEIADVLVSPGDSVEG